jgi:hypothetical protein
LNTSTLTEMMWLGIAIAVLAGLVYLFGVAMCAAARRKKGARPIDIGGAASMAGPAF